MAVLNKDAMRRIAVIAGSYLEKRNALARSQESISIVESLRARLAQAEQHMETSNEALAEAEKSYDDGVQSLIAEHADASEETINDTAERLAMNMVAMGLGELYEPGETDVETPTADTSAPRRKRRSKKEMAADAAQSSSENGAVPVTQTTAPETVTTSSEGNGLVIDQEGQTVSGLPQEIPVGDPVNPETAPDAGATAPDAGGVTENAAPVEEPSENWIENGVATAVASVQEEIHDDIPFDVPASSAPVTEAPEPETQAVEEAGSEVQPSRPVLRPVLRRPTSPRAL